MSRSHRVGTLTLGISLIVFGGLFLLRAFLPAIDYRFILHLWPVILIFLGIEVMLSFFLQKEEKIKYDLGAILITGALSLFAMAMGAAEFVLTEVPHGVIHIY